MVNLDSVRVRSLTLVQLIQVFDSWAGRALSIHIQEVLAAVPGVHREAPTSRLKELGLEPVPMIAFPKGAWYALDSVSDLGYNVVGLDWLHDPAQAVRTVGDRPIVLQGNADPGVLYGSHEAITETVKELVEGFGWAERKQGWIVNLGHGKINVFSIHMCLSTMLIATPGITPFVNPNDLRFFFEEIHRLTKTA